MSKSRTTTDEPLALPAVHPGALLRELYLEPLELSAGALAKRLMVPRTRIERLVNGQTGLSSDTAMRLARFFNTTPNYWLNLQQRYDLALAANASDYDKIEPLSAA
ncbi:MAG: HigA family addiction module antitoxin [Hyphomicrobiales bacterium]|jgi:antitoxin HigA-1